MRMKHIIAEAMCIIYVHNVNTWHGDFLYSSFYFEKMSGAGFEPATS